MRIGLVIPPELKIQEFASTAKACEDNGLDSVWVTESYAGDAFSLCSLISTKTDRIRIGTSVVSIFTRSAPLIAMSARTVEVASSGRFILGLGSSHSNTVEQKHGLKYDRPFTRMRDYASVIRTILAGKSTYHGKTLHVDGFRLETPPFREHVPIYIAAVGAKMMKLANEIGDGALMYLTPPEYIRRSMISTITSRSENQDSARGFEVACLLIWCMSERREAALTKSKRILAHYMRLPTYNKVMKEMGFVREAEDMAQGRLHGLCEEEIASMIPDRVANSFCAAGTYEDCKLKLEELKAAGVTLPIIYPHQVDMDARLYIEKTIVVATS